MRDTTVGVSLHVRWASPYLQGYGALEMFDNLGDGPRGGEDVQAGIALDRKEFCEEVCSTAIGVLAFIKSIDNDKNAWVGGDDGQECG